MTATHVDMFLLARRISAYTGADVLLGVFTTREQAEAARTTYLARYAADPASDPWHAQAYKDDGLVADDLVVTSLPGPGEATEVFVVSGYLEGFGQIVRTFESIHDSAAMAAARIEALEAEENEYPQYALRQRAPVDTLISDAREAQPSIRDALRDTAEPD